MMKRLTANSVLLLALALSAPLGFASETDWAERAITSMERTATETCSYTLTMEAGDGSEITETRVERFDPASGNDGWVLVSVDGEAPSKSQLEEYASTADERAERDHPCDLDIRELAEPGSLKVIEDNATRVRYRFQPIPEDDEDSDDAELLEHLVGTLSINKSGPYITEIMMRNEDPFSPGRGIKVQLFQMSFEFAPQSDGSYACTAFEVRTRVKQFLGRPVEERLRGTFSDVTRVGS